MARYRVSIKVPVFIDKVIVCPVLLWRRLWYGYTFRRVKLLPDRYALVEPRDFDEMSKYIWWAKDNDGTFKAVRFLPGGNCGLPVYMHRQILGAKKGQIIDHIDRNGLNNCRGNLRFATKSQNNMNRSGRKGTSSKYKGVSWYTSRKCWRAMIHVEGKGIFLGYFESEREAARAYDEAARKYHGEFAYQNIVPLKKQRGLRFKLVHAFRRLYNCDVNPKSHRQKHKQRRSIKSQVAE